MARLLNPKATILDSIFFCSASWLDGKKRIGFPHQPLNRCKGISVLWHCLSKPLVVFLQPLLELWQHRPSAVAYWTKKGFPADHFDISLPENKQTDGKDVANSQTICGRLYMKSRQPKLAMNQTANLTSAYEGEETWYKILTIFRAIGQQMVRATARGCIKQKYSLLTTWLPEDVNPLPDQAIVCYSVFHNYDWKLRGHATQ